MPRRERSRQRRRWQRLPLAIPAFVRGVDEQGKEFLEFGSILNISDGGALLAVRRYMRRSSSVSVEIPSTALTELATRGMDAKVVRVTPFEGGSLFGLRFARPTTQS